MANGQATSPVLKLQGLHKAA